MKPDAKTPLPPSSGFSWCLERGNRGRLFQLEEAGRSAWTSFARSTASTAASEGRGPWHEPGREPMTSGSWLDGHSFWSILRLHYVFCRRAQ
eukprot:scaffold34_cov260-Pinguiococcus_pyrenoidosus.AAC.22